MAEELPLSWQQCYRKSWNHREKSKCRQCWLALWWYRETVATFQIFFRKFIYLLLLRPSLLSELMLPSVGKANKNTTQSHIGPLALVVWGIKHYTTQRIKFEDICFFIQKIFPIGYYFFASIFSPRFTISYYLFSLGYYFFVSIFPRLLFLCLYFP